MFQKLKQKWKVNNLQLVLILCTFAIGGTLTGKIGRLLLNSLFDIENKIVWVVLYILLITLIWPLMVIIVSIPLGQFVFFKQYLKKIGKRFGINK